MTADDRTHTQEPPEGGGAPAPAPDPASGGPLERAPYHPPRLERYGRLTEITHLGGSFVIDSGGGLGPLP